MKKLFALLVCVLLVFALASCDGEPCSHTDANKDHICDYGCSDAIGNCADADKDHDCDYGCNKTFGEHIDGYDDNHLCDYGCQKSADEGCYDTVVDGKCDECGADIEHTCVDENKNHACDICSTSMGDHIDAGKDHNCDYGCADKIGTCEDEDKDHDCDYGCDKIFGEHADGNDNNHLCDYGCEKIADEGCYDTVVDGKCDECGADIDHTCVDENKNHACDICSTSMGNHIDAGKDHNCDYGCADKIGTCEDEDKDHNCDYGCHKVIGVCEDANKDHVCDYGCNKTFGEHSDSATDGDHACDYGCKEAIEYTATFKVGDEIINTVKYTIGSDSITVPAVPTRVGYTGVWESYSLDEENITVNAIYTAIEYTATFMDGTTVVGKVKFTVETQFITEPAVPEHSGYVGSWESYTLGAEDITVNAVYSIKQYTITWKNNDGTVIKTTKCDHGSMPSFGSEMPTRESDSQYSYTFSGWATEIATATEDATYVAIYTKSNRTSYTISYDANGGTNAPSSQRKTKGNSVTLTSTIPAYESKAFVGWYCANDGKIYKSGTSFNVDSDVTLYAVWGHECNGCNGSGSVTSSYSCSSCSGSGKTSYTEDKYVVCSNCSGGYIYTSKACSSCHGIGANILYMCSSGHSWWTSTRPSQYCPSCGRTGSAYTSSSCSSCGGDGLTSSATVCYKCQGDGAFKGTVTKTKDCSSCNGSGSKHNTQTCSTCNGSKVFADSYNSYTVTLKDCGSTLATFSVSVNMPYKLTVPTRNGYTFVGWFDSAENGTQYTDGAGICLSVWSESDNKILYARWSLNYYTITYDCDEDVDLSGMPTVYTVEDEDFALNSQNKTHYSFSWKLDNITVASIDTALARDIVVKGVWASLANAPVTENRVEATCTKDGHYDRVVYCSVCQEELSRETITLTKLGHSRNAAVEENRVEATCTEDGHYDSVVYCNRCDEELSRTNKTITKLGHSPELPVEENQVEKTCSTDGHYDSVVYCGRCDEELSRETITIPAAHTPKSAIQENRVESTCTEDGHYDIVVYCSVCNKELSRETIILTKLGHSTKTIEENRIEATCYEDGSYDKVVYCDRCNSELSRETKVIPQTHKYKGTTCTECGLQYKREGNYIYFGEYPQTIKSNNVTITATQDTRGYYLGSDGNYYAKVVAKPYNSGYTFSTGASVSNGATYYFKVEPIRWRILSNDGETAIILCDSIIANRRYDDSCFNNNYKDSEIREWLNATFYETAFTELQREIILTTTVDNSAYSTGYSSNSYACENTNDKIFLLSYSEVTNSAYGFASSNSTEDTARRMQTSDYSRATGAYMDTSSDYYGNGYWWLRSPGRGSDYACAVLGGNADKPYYINCAFIGVVPALQIRL